MLEMKRAVVHLDGVSLDDTPILRVEPGQTEPVRNSYRHHPPLPGSALDHTTVMQSGSPELQAEVSDELLQKLASNAAATVVTTPHQRCSSRR
jgi:hypothetical protein